jgi:hypothetical protein
MTRSTPLLLLATLSFTVAGFLAFMVGVCVVAIVSAPLQSATTCAFVLGGLLLAGGVCAWCLERLDLPFNGQRPVLDFYVTCIAGGALFDALPIPSGFKLIGLGLAMLGAGAWVARYLRRSLVPRKELP